LIDETAEINKEFNATKKSLDIKKVKLKEAMEEWKLSSLASKKYMITYTPTEKQSMIPDKTLEVAKNEGLNWLIKTTEFVDLEELENSLVAKEIDGKLFQDCIETSTTYTLRFKKAK
jgi:hypothetical protein